MPAPVVHVIGAGSAGLMAAETLAGGGARVVVHDRMPSVARKFLMAGGGGLNLTHSEPLEPFLGRYGPARARLEAWLKAFGPADLVAWCEALGQPTFVGSSGRVFPKAMKASPLLRAWLRRLDDLGVEVRTRSEWRGWRGGALLFATPDGEREEGADAVVLALGGASWPKLGSDGRWTGPVSALGVAVDPFAPSNAGVAVRWSAGFAERFAGQPLKGVRLTVGGASARGEAMITRYGLEGGAVYALSAALRDAVEGGEARLLVDLKPDLGAEALAERLARIDRKASLANRLRKAANLSPAGAALLREAGSPPTGPRALAERIKALPLGVIAMQGLERAISSAGGVVLDEADDRLMLRRSPGVFVAGEMLDWEAPTGGYLLQGCFSSAVVAAEGACRRLALSAS